MKNNCKHRFFQLISVVMLFTLLLVGCDSVAKNKNTVTDDEDFMPVMGKPMESGTTGNSDSSGKKRVAITFDDGPHNVYTKKIVDELAKYGAHATFFVIGNRVDGTEYNGKAGLEYAIQNGNEIGIHGYTHKKYYNKCSDDEYKYELSSTAAAIRSVSPSANVKLMRPIGGAITDARVSSCSYSVIMWDVDSEDWKNKYSGNESEAERRAIAERIANNVISNVKDGSIILMHDIYGSTYDALAIVLEQLYAEGYEVVTVSELIGSDLHSGEKYFSGR